LVAGKTFGSVEEFREAFSKAAVDVLSVTVSAG